MTTTNIIPERIDGIVESIIAACKCELSPAVRDELRKARYAAERAFVLSGDWAAASGFDVEQVLDTLAEAEGIPALTDAELASALVEFSEHGEDWARVTIGAVVYLLFLEPDGDERNGRMVNTSYWTVVGRYVA